jgi:hypothetical protein
LPSVDLSLVIRFTVHYDTRVIYRCLQYRLQLPNRARRQTLSTLSLMKCLQLAASRSIPSCKSLRVQNYLPAKHGTCGSQSGLYTHAIDLSSSRFGTMSLVSIIPSYSSSYDISYYLPASVIECVVCELMFNIHINTSICFMYYQDLAVRHDLYRRCFRCYGAYTSVGSYTAWCSHMQICPFQVRVWS